MLIKTKLKKGQFGILKLPFSKTENPRYSCPIQEPKRTVKTLTTTKKKKL